MTVDGESLTLDQEVRLTALTLSIEFSKGNPYSKQVDAIKLADAFVRYIMEPR